MANFSIAPMKVNTMPKTVSKCLEQFCDFLYRFHCDKNAFANRGNYFVFEDGATFPTQEQRKWKIQNFNYNNVAAAMLTLFAVQTTEGWPT